MRRLLLILGHALVFVVLTVLTQVGGLVWLLSLLIRRKWKLTSYRWLIFPGLYFLVWALLPVLAKPLGRVPMPLWASAEKPLQPQNLFIILANRHYVRPPLRDETLAVARQLQTENPDMILTYLDANFPFLKGFPLLPHRSHHDGQKLDLAFFYQYQGKLASRAPALLGYGRCAEPQSGERDQPQRCADSGYWQYSLLPRLARPFRRSGYLLDEAATRQMVRAFARQPAIGKLFLEPHLKTRWRLGQYSKIRFHGCAAVRHDDHLHVQMGS